MSPMRTHFLYKEKGTGYTRLPSFAFDRDREHSSSHSLQLCILFLGKGTS